MLPVVYFFSAPRRVPERCAAFKALLPLMTVSRGMAPPPLCFLPILVTESQSLILVVLGGVLGVVERVVVRGGSGEI